VIVGAWGYRTLALVAALAATPFVLFVARRTPGPGLPR
jgi:hypothetical protein